MTTQKQIEANQQNALLSTGAKTEAGKTIVSKNAISHGIFTSDLIISKGDGQENICDYNALLDGLILSLQPSNQMENLLVEKIAVDYWRLKRVIRFETGNIRKHLDMAIHDYYKQTGSFGAYIHKNATKLKDEIAQKQETLAWYNKYIKALQQGTINLEKPTFESDELTVNIEDDLAEIIDAHKAYLLTEDERRCYHDGLNLEQMKAIFKKAGYTHEDIITRLIFSLEKQRDDIQEQLHELEQQKLKNDYSEETSIQSNNLPENFESERLLGYERSIQKSIMQNLLLLKKLQGVW